MLSDNNIRRINEQIARELRNVNSITTNNSEKMAALERVAKLKELLEDTKQPSRGDILSELADALTKPRDDRHIPLNANLFESIFGRRR